MPVLSAGLSVVPAAANTVGSVESAAAAVGLSHLLEVSAGSAGEN